MKKINISEYKGSRIYFYFFDIYLKINDIRKEEIFAELYINNSSYRRSRDYEQKVGKQIIKQLSNHFDFVIPEPSLVEQLETKINEIYYNMYYRIYDSYDDDLAFLNKLLDENTLLGPIIKLIKLFMLVNTHKSISYVKKNYQELYEDVKRYYDFFILQLKEIYEILNLFFDSDIILSDEWRHNYKNAMSYQIVASKCYSEKKYIETIFFGKCAQDILYKDLNFKRIISVNRTIMSSYLYIGNYDECLNIAEKQILYLKSIDFSDYEIESAIIFETVALLALERYQDVKEKLKDYQKMNLTLITCMLVSLFKIEKKEYVKFYNENIEYLDEEDKKFFILLNDYLKNPVKTTLSDITKYQIMGPLLKILKNFKNRHK